MAMNEAAVRVENIVKGYPLGFLGRRRKPVLEGVTLEVPEGLIYGILGPNGAGKTTLLSIISGLLLPDSGTVRVLGRDALRNADFVRRSVNLCSGNPNFVWSLTVAENLTYYGMLYGLIGAALRRRIDEMVELLELQQYRNTRFDELSTGTKQRLALAKALLSSPRILFLDEPTIGLDPHMAVKMRRAILDIHERSGITILLTSHYMKEVEEVCARVAFLRDGKLAAEGTPDELKQKVSFKVKQPTMEDVFLELIQ